MKYSSGAHVGTVDLDCPDCIRFHPFDDDEQVTVTVATTVESCEGQSLGSEFSFGFRTHHKPAANRPFQVIYESPVNGGPMVNPEANIYVNMSNDINPATLVGCCEVRDGENNLVPGSHDPDTTDTICFNPYDPFAASDTITVTVKAYLRATDGTQLGEDHVFSFTTLPDPAPPVETHSGTLETDETWGTDAIHVINGDVTIPAGITLTISPGVVVKFAAVDDQYGNCAHQCRNDLIVSGALDLRSASDSRIVLTSSRDDLYGGDSNGDGGGSSPGSKNWGALIFEGGVSHELHDAIVHYGGVRDTWYETWGGDEYRESGDVQIVWARGADTVLTVRDCEIANSRVGLGVSGTLGGKRIRVGTREYVVDAAVDGPDDTIGATFWVSCDDRCVGRMAMVDSARTSAAPAVGELRLLGISGVHLLSGDRPDVVESLAAGVGVGVDAWAGELLPDGKVERLRTMRQMGKKIMYVSDGIDDGSALATSHVGVAMGAGASPLALETADIGILKPDLSLVPALIRLGCVTRRRIRENPLVFAVLYNGAAIVLASLGVLSPIMAAIAHNVGSVAVVLNSARLIRWSR